MDMGSKQKVQTHSPGTFFKHETLSIDEQCISLLHFMLPVGISKNYCRSYEFRQIICHLNKHSQNKHIFVRFSKFTFLRLISTTTVFLVNVMSKLTTFNGIKGNNSFRLQRFSTDS